MSELTVASTISKTDGTSLDPEKVLIEYGFKFEPVQEVSADGRVYTHSLKRVAFARYKIKGETSTREITRDVTLAQRQSLTCVGLEAAVLNYVLGEHSL